MIKDQRDRPRFWGNLGGGEAILGYPENDKVDSGVPLAWCEDFAIPAASPESTAIFARYPRIDFVISRVP